MNPVAFMRELVAKGMSWEDAADIADRFQQSIEDRVREALIAAAPTRTAAAERQAAYRARQRNAEHNAEHNALHNAEDNGVDNAPLSLPPSPQTPLPPTLARECVSSRGREDAAFERFWTAYPRKTAKGDARKAFAKAVRKLGRPDAEGVLIGALERAKAAWVDAQFIPHAATWLNGERWEDEPETAAPRKAHERPHTDQRQAAREDSLRTHRAGAMAALNRRLGAVG